MRWTDDKIESLAERLETNQCPDNHGCGTQPACACADAEDAAEVLRQLHDEVKALREDKRRLDLLGEHCTHALDSERYLSRQIYWGEGTHRDIRQAIDAALSQEDNQ